MSHFGVAQLRSVGFSPYYVPHCVGTAVYRPMDKCKARAAIGLPIDCIVVGMVAANNDCLSRKAIPQCVRAFALFRARHPESLLYLHSPSHAGAGVDIDALAEKCGVAEAVVRPATYDAVVGRSDEHMVNLYNAFDMLLNPSLGEGFGVPIIEAQACGCTVVVGEWTGMSELCRNGVRIARSEADELWTPLHSWQFVPRVSAIVDAMERLHESGSAGTGRIGLAESMRDYDAEEVVDRYWIPTLCHIAERLRLA